jgi:microsomal dipeptidase-like Zn-dependent dipeptidase
MTKTEDTGLLTRAATLHARMRTLDGHADVPLDISAADLSGDSGPRSQVDLAKARLGGLNGAVLTVHAGAARAGAAGTASGWAELAARYELITRFASDYPDRVGLASTPEEFRSHVDGGRFAVIVGYQNAAPLAGGLAELEGWLDRGIQVFGFTFIGNNQWADSARPYPFILPTSAGGLTSLGRDAVHLLNQRGTVIDVSQLSSAAFADVLARTEAPVLASHTAIREIVDVERNITDRELDALRGNGGLVQIVGFGPYLRRPDRDMVGRLEAQWRHYGLAVTGRLADLLSVNDPVTATWDEDKFWTFLHEFHVILELDKPIATTADLADHIDHAVNRIGISHVGISSDFNHSGGLADWLHAGQSQAVTAELLRRGYSDADIERLWSENFLDLWERVRSVNAS